MTTDCQRALLKMNRAIYPARLEIIEPLQANVLHLLSPKYLTTLVVHCSLPPSVALDLFLHIHLSPLLQTVSVSKIGRSFLKYLPSLAQIGVYFGLKACFRGWFSSSPKPPTFEAGFGRQIFQSPSLASSLYNKKGTV